MIQFHEFDALEVIQPLNPKTFWEAQKAARTCWATAFEQLRKLAMAHNFPVVFISQQRKPEAPGDFILTIPRETGRGRIRLRLINLKSRALAEPNPFFYDPNGLAIRTNVKTSIKIRKNR